MIDEALRRMNTGLRLRSERLLKLAEHLEGGKLSVENFSMKYWLHKDERGTHGCALTECAVLFPKEWYSSRFGNDVFPFIWGVHNSIDSAAAFFYMHRDEACAMFLPSRVGILSSEAPKGYIEHERTRDKVAAEIRAFVELGTMYRALVAVWGEESLPLI